VSATNGPTSWRTTAVAIATLVGALATGVAAYLDDDATTGIPWDIIWQAGLAVAVAIGFWNAADHRALVLLLFLLPLGGCSLLLPGLDTRVAHTAKSETHWSKDGDFRLIEDTTHRRMVLTVEGTNVEVELNDEGNPIKITGAENALVERSDPAEVAGSYQHLATQNLAFGTGLMQLAGQMFGDYMALQRQRGEIASAVQQAPTTCPAGETCPRADLIRRIEEALRKQLGG